MKWLFQRTAIILPGILNNSQDLTVYIPLSEQHIEINTVASRFLYRHLLVVVMQSGESGPFQIHFNGARTKGIPNALPLLYLISCSGSWFHGVRWLIQSLC